MEDIQKARQEVIKSLIKKAKGYTYQEECTEYVYNDDGERKQKKKITTKLVPPDVSALKNAIELIQEQDNEVINLTDQQLEDEINKILQEIERIKK